MANPVVDVEENLANFPSGSNCAITAAQLRLFVQSIFGYATTTDPTPNNDFVDTSGIGSTFDTGNPWYNLSTFTPWWCVTGQPAGFARWVTFPIVTGDPSINVTKVISSGNISYNLSLVCPISLACVPDLPANKITSGTFSLSQIPALPASQITSGTFSLSQIPALPASQITSGTFSVGQIPALPASQITSGTFSLSQIPALPASQITSGTFPLAVIPFSATAGGTPNSLAGSSIVTILYSQLSQIPATVNWVYTFATISGGYQIIAVTSVCNVKFTQGPTGTAIVVVAEYSLNGGGSYQTLCPINNVNSGRDSEGQQSFTDVDLSGAIMRLRFQLNASVGVTPTAGSVTLAITGAATP